MDTIIAPFMRDLSEHQVLKTRRPTPEGDRALPADSLEYLVDAADGNAALPTATGAGTGLALVVAAGGAEAGAGGGAAGAAVV
jgi:hypothetical protein